MAGLDWLVRCVGVGVVGYPGGVIRENLIQGDAVHYLIPYGYDMSQSIIIGGFVFCRSSRLRYGFDEGSVQCCLEVNVREVLTFFGLLA